MDPLAHTLFGATLAEAGLKRRTRYATATLLIAANLPDVDAVAGLWGGDVELYFRRGWTHGVLALLVWPLLLMAGMWVWHRWRAGIAPGRGAAHTQSIDSGAPDAPPPFRPRAILALAFLGVWSHPFLDWLNTYGVRWLMPFDGRWFYGDTLFIVEPWFWLLMAAGVVMARSSTRRSIAGWLLLAALATALVLATNIVPLWVKIVWCAGVMLLALLRWNMARTRSWLSAENLACIGLVLLVAYIGVSYGVARTAEQRTVARFAGAEQVQSNPSPGNPFSQRLLVVQPDRYVILAENGAVHELPRQPVDAVIRAALEDESIRGFANWLRYADWTVEDRPDHWVVKIRDLRYQGPDITNLRDFGTATVAVPKPAASD